MIAGYFVVWWGPHTIQSLFTGTEAGEQLLMMKYLLGHPPPPQPPQPPHRPPAISTSDRLMTSRKQCTSSENEEFPPSHCSSAEPSSPGPQPSLPPCSILCSHPCVALGHCWKCALPVWFMGPGTPRSEHRLFCRGPRRPCEVMQMQPRGQFTGYGTAFAASGTKWHRISIPRQQNSHCFLPTPWPRPGSIGDSNCGPDTLDKHRIKGSMLGGSKVLRWDVDGDWDFWGSIPVWGHVDLSDVREIRFLVEYEGGNDWIVGHFVDYLISILN